jgi:hypothetical protein
VRKPPIAITASPPTEQPIIKGKLNLLLLTWSVLGVVIVLAVERVLVVEVVVEVVVLEG